jgi:hypothetical protein
MFLNTNKYYEDIAKNMIFSDRFGEFVLSIANSTIILGFLGLFFNTCLGCLLISFADSTYQTRFEGSLMWLGSIPIHSNYAWVAVFTCFFAGFVPSLMSLRAGLSLRMFWKKEKFEKLTDGIKTLKYLFLYSFCVNVCVFFLLLYFVIIMSRHFIS